MPPAGAAARRPLNHDFKFKEGNDVFAPKDLVELARPGTGIPNAPGDLVLVSSSKYSFKAKKNNKSIFIAPLESTVQPLEIPLTTGGDAFWLDSRTVGHVVASEEKDVQELYAISVKFTAEDAQAELAVAPESPVLVGSFPTKGAGNFRFDAASGLLVFSEYVYPDGDLKTVKQQDEEWGNRGNTAWVYDDTFVRHWDTWRGPKMQQLFAVSLQQDFGRKWHLGTEFYAPLNGTGHSSPVEPFGGTDDFDVSGGRIVYTAKDPELLPAAHTKQNIYIVNAKGGSKPVELTSGKQGATHSPVFSPKGDKVAWLELDEDGYESDRAKIVIYDLVTDVRYTLTQDWDRSPDAITFATDGKSLFFTAGDEAKIKVFNVLLPPTPSHSTTHPKFSADYTPKALTSKGAASGVRALPNGRLVFTASSLTKPNDVYIIRGLDKEGGSTDPKIEQVTKFTEEALKAKELPDGEEVWFEGAGGRKVQGWAIKPKGWKEGEKKKWPAVLLIHGGPQGAWEDQWSTRWNPQVFAQQGYFTVALNPTGSTTFGQEFTDAIAEDWGGKPFVDMIKGWKHVLDKYPEIDSDRAVAAGASWGGYAINWIQGHPEYGFGFKALVGHDGVFDANYNGYSTDELFFFNHEWGGAPWQAKSKALSEKYSPSNFVANWSTPQLLIHGSKDYRLPETESIGAFHALQQKGIPSRLVIFPDENHWVLNHGNSLKWHYEVFRWFDEFVGEH
ncbi:alpha/beta-hydrolase [Punctularia strigosozonata HHB-11173 SS5]|uniref:alpha/beta-hydrolase n=1 Tax=Punctularia strigosozonata (strain HHB-11173) TaxID=741275 RepID=UPI0004416A38|nr:alpha/beta-hydrolase [Punctularia strigosozonata HHB-11173 SS5]EIN12412.1 alpha/beta-hydrolase [Punctularia strigosozonata HHB-11173 SS5]